jgi:hypothetical protein
MDLEVIDSPRRQQCRRLRSKGMFIEIERAPADAEIPSMSDGFVWCTHTHNCLGPDGRVADVDTCLPGRACWER